MDSLPVLWRGGSSLGYVALEGFVYASFGTVAEFYAYRNLEVPTYEAGQRQVRASIGASLVYGGGFIDGVKSGVMSEFELDMARWAIYFGVALNVASEFIPAGFLSYRAAMRASATQAARGTARE